MTRIASKFGIAAALTLGMFSTAAAQVRTTNPTTKAEVSKGEVAPRVDTVTIVRRDTVTVFRRDTVTVAGPTVTRWDTVTVTEIPGWLDRGHGLYFGAGAGSYYPSAALGTGQIPGYAFQMNLGIDPAGSPLGFRVTGQLARPDESQPFAGLGARPTIWNFTADLKLRLPFLTMTRFPSFGLDAVGGGAYVRGQDVRYQTEATASSLKTTVIESGYHDAWGWDLGGGATLSLGHKRELFLEARAINYRAGDNLEKAHQFPLILGVNWY
jgi:hypothetical protein